MLSDFSTGNKLLPLKIFNFKKGDKLSPLLNFQFSTVNF